MRYRPNAPLTSAALVLGASLAQAQQDDGVGNIELPQIVVTAERVESTLRKTPVSVVPIGEEEIGRRGISQLADMVGVVAGMTVPNGFSNMPQAVGIRGVGVSNAAMSQAVGIYVDDVPLVRGYATALWDLPDIERIEVLRGPQGTLYGQNASAGAVRIISRDPDASGQRWVSLSAGNRGALEAHGYGTFSLNEAGSNAASVALSLRRNDGFARNETLNRDVNALDASQFRVKFKSSLSDSLVAVVAVDGLRDKSDANTTNYPLNHPGSRPRVTFTSDPALGAFEREAGGAQLRLEQRFGPDLLLRSITAYRFFDDDPTRPDFGGLETRRYALDQVVRQKVWSQELQLQGRSDIIGAPATWTVGAMGVVDRFDFGRYTTAVPLATDSPAYTEARTHQKTRDLGVYGQMRLALAEKLRLTLGARAYDTRQTGLNAFWRLDAQRNRITTVYDAPDLSFKKSGFLPRVGLDYQATDAHLFYASLSEGAKFGGFNRAAESLTSALVATQPERVRTYEIGAKSRFAEGRVTTNVAAFYNDYRDYLAALNNVTINGVLVTDATLVNAGKAKTYGVDVEMAAKLTRELEWSASAEWLDSKFVDFVNPTGAPGSNFVGNRLPYAPRTSAGTSLVYKAALPDGSGLRADLSAQYIARQFADAANTGLLAIPSQTYLHLGAAYTTADGHWTFSLRVRNAENKTYVLIRTRIPPLGVDSAYYNPPRTVLLTARYDY